MDNPLLELFRQGHGAAPFRDEAIVRYGFAIPSEEALQLMRLESGGTVVELGAGTGYWAWMLSQVGVDVVAYDLHPPPSNENQWFAGTTPWHPVLRRDASVLTHHVDAALLLVWPTVNETWPAEAVELFHQEGGSRLFYVGNGPGGDTGDDRFHALLGAIDDCYACAYDLPDSACTCGVAALWTRRAVLRLPNWEGCSDRLEIYHRADARRRRMGAFRRSQG